MIMKVAIVTPTIGSENLEKCINSVQTQIYTDVKHYVFVDGHQHEDQVNAIINQARLFDVPLAVSTLAENVGANGWYGHRVYAACSFLVNADVICYLDEDNYIEPNHVLDLVSVMEEKELDWAYSLRKIVGPLGDEICRDNCESLGKWPAYVGNEVFHIDTSCFMVKRDIATTIGHAWYSQWGADRRFFAALKQYFPKHDTSGSYSLCYRLGGNEGSVTEDFFHKGNAIMKERYPDQFPWDHSAVEY
jgi:glycosyltransferase involved in cell wall biosynthesis